MMDNKKINTEKLLQHIGALISLSDLAKVLSYKSIHGLKKGIAENRIKIKVFEIEGRRGKFALTSDVEKWLYEVSDSKVRNQTKENRNK